MKRALMTAAMAAGVAISAVSAFADHKKVVVFTDGDRDAYRTYYTDTWHDGCPTSLTRVGDACLPAGVTARRYIVGRPLARTVVIDPVPEAFAPRLAVAPEGYRYGMVDGDVVLYNPTTRLISDAIRAFVH